MTTQPKEITESKTVYLLDYDGEIWAFSTDEKREEYRDALVGAMGYRKEYFRENDYQLDP